MYKNRRIFTPALNVPLVITVLSVCALLVLSQLYLAIPLIPVIREYFHISPIAATWIASTFGFAYAFGFLIFGPLCDRFGCKVLLVPGLAMLALITIAVGASPSFDFLIKFRTLQGFLAATFAPIALVYVSEVLPVSTRATGIACVSTGFLLAGIVGQIYSSIVILTYGWRWIFWFLAIAYTVAAFIVAYRFPDSVTKKSATSVLSVYKNMIFLLKSHRLLAAYTAAFMVLLSFVSMYSGLEPHLVSRYGISQNNLLFIRMAGIPGMLLAPFTSSFIKRWGSKNVVLTGLVLASVGLALEAISGQLLILVLSSSIFVAGISAIMPSLIALVGSIATGASGSALALYTFVLFIGASFGPLVTNLLNPIGFSGLCTILALFLLITAFIININIQGTTQIG
ncbi:MFS transporter [Fischerella thermalis]|uniref:MFS transporter n=1 Tax=Fischerella thermalis CCMEE 5318 TaxID=2019666 RepID=A0A2N6LEB6_9CYAN|nr:MFS transporter [Fischerella thermalis]PMB21654.1 MFS transporter [Fischerella thermalis CCMEE 5318]